MVYDILVALEKSGDLMKSFLLVADRNSLDGKKRLQGSLVRNVQRSFLAIDSGVAGNEEARIPLDKVIEIRSGGRTLFRKGERIERIYPR